MVDVLKLKGGGLNALGRHAVAALLSSASADVDYPYTTTEVIAAFNLVYPGGAYGTLKDILQDANELGCPLN
jgi:hypothetical protein